MGYYVNIAGNDFMIKKENYDKAYNAVCELNKHNELKRGGRYGGEPTPKPEDSKSVSNNPDKWFSWMDWNYDETCKNLAQVLEMLGFDVFENEDGICELYYNNKTGDEDIFFNALAPYVNDGSYILWRGEDNGMWAWEFCNGTMSEKQAYVTW